MNSTVKEDDTDPEDGVKKKGRTENKICLSCSADPDKMVLFRCKGCKKAWYGGARV